MNTKTQRNFSEPVLRLVCMMGTCPNDVNQLGNLGYIFSFLKPDCARSISAAGRTEWKRVKGKMTCC